MPDPTRSARVRLNAVSAQLARALKILLDASIRLDRRRTTEIAGVLGGSIGMLLGFVVSSSAPSLTFFVVGPLAAISGIAVGILAARRIEATPPETSAQIRRRTFEETQELAHYLLDQQRRLPPEAPKFVRDNLWEQYQTANARLTDLLRLDGPPSSKQTPVPPPPPERPLDPPTE